MGVWMVEWMHAYKDGCMHAWMGVHGRMDGLDGGCVRMWVDRLVGSWNLDGRMNGSMIRWVGGCMPASMGVHRRMDGWEGG